MHSEIALRASREIGESSCSVLTLSTGSFLSRRTGDILTRSRMTGGRQATAPLCGWAGSGCG